MQRQTAIVVGIIAAGLLGIVVAAIVVRSGEPNGGSEKLTITPDPPSTMGVATAVPTATVEMKPTARPTRSGPYSSCADAQRAGVPRVRGSNGPGMGFPAYLVPSARDGDGDGAVCER